MSFIYPSFLWALSAVAIPIIIHLFNFRTHKTVYFSNVAFLQNIEQETKSRNRLKDLLVLLMRILTVASLVIAFAKPVIFNNNVVIDSNCENNYGIYIDNSFSMTASNGDASSIDVAKSKAADILRAFSQSADYLILTNEISPEQQHFYIKDIAQNAVSQINTSPVFRQTSFILNKFDNLFLTLTPDCSNTLFLISDFQKNTFDPENFKTDSNTNVVLLPIVPNETSNLYIDSVWFLSPYHLANSNDSLIVRIVNNSDFDFTNQQIKLFIKDTLKTLSNFNIQKNSQIDLKLIFSNTQLGYIRARVSIDDYPITYDNDLYFNYYIAPQIKVLLIEGKPQPYLEKFYNDQKYFELTTADASNVQFSQFANYQSIILAGVSDYSSGLTSELMNFTKNGGILTVIPNVSADFSSFNNFLAQFGLPNVSGLDNANYFVKYINLQNKIYKNAFTDIKPNSEFPLAYSHLKFSSSALGMYSELLKLENDDNLLIFKELEAGAIYVFSTEMVDNISTFMLNPISIATFYNIPVFRKDNNLLYQTIGNTANIEIKNLENFEVIKMRNSQTGYEFYPQVAKISQSSIKINMADFNNEAGNYLILNQDEQIGEVSVNYNRKESNLAYYSVDELNELMKKYNLKNWQISNSSGDILQNELQTNLEGKNLWKIFIILALFFILSEILIIRIIKK